MLSVRKLSVSYLDFDAVSDVSLELESGQWLMLAGPNGAGKSTIIKAISNSLKFDGQVLVAGQDVTRLSSRQLALHMAVLQQSHAVGFAFTVEELVRFGRYAYQRRFTHSDPKGQELVEQAIAVCGLSDIRHQNVLTLSGGELQRAFLAQAFAQDAPLLLLDEPASHLDLGYQQILFDLIAQWRKVGKRAVISVVHDLLLARRYGSHALLMNQGKILASGSMDEVFAKEHLMAAYGMDVGAWLRWLHAPWQDGQIGDDSLYSSGIRKE